MMIAQADSTFDEEMPAFESKSMVMTRRLDEYSHSD